MKKQPLRILNYCAVLVLLAGLGVFWVAIGSYWLTAFIRHGGDYWVTVAADDSRLSPSMRLALSGGTEAVSGELHWRKIGTGFDVAELPAMAAGRVVDTIYLARIDPKRYRFEALNDPSGRRGLAEWMAKLHPALVVNGSYYSHTAKPDTPFVSNGTPMGPANYDARSGAFVASEAFAGIKDLSREDWNAAIHGADNAMVSYPLLLANGIPYEGKASEWLANRSFVGQDEAGRIIIGTTTDAYFSLYRLARFLRDAPLGLTYALNLDGGPVACQGVSLNGYERRTIGQWELQFNGQRGKLLRYPWGTFEMPIVLAVFPR